jgi:hypothetical protein
MKVTVQFEIDTKGTAYCPEKWGHLNVVLDNLTDLFNIRCDIAIHKLDAMCAEYKLPGTKKAVLKHYEDDLRVTEKMFDNFVLSGKFKGKSWRRNKKGMFVSGKPKRLPNEE